ncbi:hypothetical protein PYW08_004667 [Mythimna loreyi]|uniref:Uncharacterized protein n=1 Tax=Mythimna loreyi TaxID=667449 RepID=A0ACC2QPG3_9NEOP|nr:hypothetical protein PYW08_004667 [Mythimna loreyi]
MPRSSRSRTQLTDEEKKIRRREQKKLSMRRARAKLDATAIEERRRKERERYHQKKQNGLLKTIKDFTPRQRRQMRKMWREKAKLRRERDRLAKRTEEIARVNTPLSSPSSSRSSHSRVEMGKAIRLRNRRILKAQNQFLIERLNILERKLSKYRMRIIRLKKSKGQKIIINIGLRKRIHDFLINDENSRLTAGKKETITRKKVKKQIRLLNDTLLNLHKKFNNTTGLNISYETFRRHRPFWVMFPKAASRNTCLCAVHTNNDFIVRALHQNKILNHYSATDLAKSLCCNNAFSVPCLERKCSRCSERVPKYNLLNGNDTIIYQRWVTKNCTVVIKGNEKICKKTVKENVKTSHQLLVNILNKNLPIFMQHLANITNQYNAIKFIKQSLSPSEGLLHIDFSENYACKYGSEIQSAHFGGSKSQLSLHTCVYYSANSEPPQNIVKTTSFCSVSENLRHDPVLICAHLTPIIERIKIISPYLKELHILSDGPTTQYRNKTMFHLIANYVSKISNAERIVWHFSEAGHGKGAPDGVGGCVKRTCDNMVAHGRDITNIDSFVSCLKDNCKGIEIIPVDDTDVPGIQRIADANKCRPFKGTFQIHQVVWNATEPNLLHARRLSCISCATHVRCPHFEIGQIHIECVPDPVEDSSVGSLRPSPSISMTNSPSSHRTASVSTITGPRTPSPLLLTPSPELLNNVTSQPCTPRKRYFCENSDGSITPPKKPKARPSFFDNYDSDENIF